MTRQCELCGTTDNAVRPALAWYLSGGVKVVDRCEDVAACQERVEDAGGEWPLVNAEQARRLYAVGGWPGVTLNRDEASE